jgi:uncharacterized oligopeptide transporter (OPT) family protein
MPAPQATLMSMIVNGVIGGELPYTLVGAGIILGIVMLLLGIPVLPFALGLYLPLSLTAATMFGGLVRAYVNKYSNDEQTQERGTLLAAGFVGGDACVGVLIALLTITHIIPPDAPGLLPQGFSLAAFILMGLGLGYWAMRSSTKS